MPTHSRSRVWKWLITLVLLGGGAAAGWYYYSRSSEDLPEFRTATASRGDLTQAVTANGQLTPVVNVEVGSQISGIIEKIHTDYNANVTNGQVIAQIESSTYQASLAQSEGELASARASLELAAVEARRAEELFKSNLISSSEHDQAVANLHMAEATVKIREASRMRTRTDLERTTILAPINGIVISRNVEVGQTVAASFNTPKLFQIANDLSKMEIEAMVSEADIGGVEEGQLVNFNVDAFPTRQYQGRIRQVRYAPSTNQNVVSYTTVVSVENPDLKLRPGMTANASIIVGERRGVLRIPNAALRFRPPEGFTVVQETNRPASAPSPSGTNAPPAIAAAPIATSGPFAGLPTPPWTLAGRRPTPQEREQFEASLNPEQREQYRQARERMRARFTEGGGPGGGDGGQGFGSLNRATRSIPDGPRIQTVYLAITNNSHTAKSRVTIKAVTLKTGISDGSSTEVHEGLKEGDVVIVGLVRPEPAIPTASPPRGGSPFGGPFGPRRF